MQCHELEFNQVSSFLINVRVVLSVFLLPSRIVCQQRRWLQAPTEQKIATTHLSVTDQYGNIVSWTTSVEQNLGCAVTVPGESPVSSAQHSTVFE